MKTDGANLSSICEQMAYAQELLDVLHNQYTEAPPGRDKAIIANDIRTTSGILRSLKYVLRLQNLTAPQRIDHQPDADDRYQLASELEFKL